MYFRGYAKIDLDAIYKNILALKANLKKGTGVVAVIKTDGYGHGAVPIAKAIDDLVERYAVATVFEARNLIRHGIKKPIILLGYTPEATYDIAIENDIRMVVYSYEMAKAMNDHGKTLGKKVKINIAVDTGMSRIGFLPSKTAVDEIQKISGLSNIDMEGIFTHFAKADESDKTSAKKQLKEFVDFVQELENLGITIPIHHCANSAAMMEMPQTSMTMSRAGIAMYGLYPSEEVDKNSAVLIPALSLHSHVVHVKTIAKGRGVSYGHTFIAEKETKVATIPLGYGDGYFRSLSNKGYVLIKGHKVKIIGRVCMDQFMVDVTGLDVKIGDEVTLIGKEGREQITVEELAALAGSFNYELVCDLGKRIPRVYMKDGKIVGTKDYYDDLYEVDL